MIRAVIVPLYLRIQIRCACYIYTETSLHVVVNDDRHIFNEAQRNRVKDKEMKQIRQY